MTKLFTGHILTLFLIFLSSCANRQQSAASWEYKCLTCYAAQIDHEQKQADGSNIMVQRFPHCITDILNKQVEEGWVFEAFTLCPVANTDDRPLLIFKRLKE